MEKEQLKVEMIPLALIDRPAVPDREYIDPDEIKELADSIAQTGLQQPVKLNKRGGRFEIIYGDRRYLAHVSLGRQEIPAFVVELEALDVSMLRAIENIQRTDLNVIEEARVYKRLHDEHGVSWEEISRQTGKSVALVRRRYHLLDMPECLVKAMQQKKIIYVVAEELNRLGDVAEIEYLLSFAIDHGATKDIVRGWVNEKVAERKQMENAGAGGYRGSSVQEIKPVYVPCDLCSEAMKIGQETVLRVCGSCIATIKANM